MALLAVIGLAAVGLAAGTPGAAAQDKLQCDAPGTTAEMTMCAEIDLEAADGDMNAAYKRALARIKAHTGDPPYDSAAYEAAFRAAQRAWIAFRDADCKGVVPFEWGGGTGTGPAVIGCLATLTRARTKDIDEVAADR